MPNLHSDRSDGRFCTIEGLLHARLKLQLPSLAFSPTFSSDEQAEWRQCVRGKLRELLAFPEGLPTQPEARWLWTEKRDGYELQKWEIYPEPDSVVPFLMLVPEGVAASAPGAAVMCFPGSTTTKERLAGEPEIVDWPAFAKHSERNNMAQHYVRAGLIVVAIDHPDIGERTNNMFGNSRYEVGVHALWLGRSLEGISVFEKWCVYNWLKQQPFVDSGRIAVSGHSLGAKSALHLAVIEPKIAAIVWNDGCCNWRVREVMACHYRTHLGHYVPAMQQWFDYTDLMAALAPRPLLISEGGRTEHIERIREAWHFFGAEQNFMVTYYPKFSSPKQRPHDNEPLFVGMSQEEFLEYANIDVPQHCFKENIAVPWLQKALDHRS